MSLSIVSFPNELLFHFLSFCDENTQHQIKLTSWLFYDCINESVCGTHLKEREIIIISNVSFSQQLAIYYARYCNVFNRYLGIEDLPYDNVFASKELLDEGVRGLNLNDKVLEVLKVIEERCVVNPIGRSFCQPMTKDEERCLQVLFAEGALLPFSTEKDYLAQLIKHKGSLDLVRTFLETDESYTIDSYHFWKLRLWGADSTIIDYVLGKIEDNSLDSFIDLQNLSALLCQEVPQEVLLTCIQKFSRIDTATFLAIVADKVEYSEAVLLAFIEKLDRIEREFFFDGIRNLFSLFQEGRCSFDLIAAFIKVSAPDEDLLCRAVMNGYDERIILQLLDAQSEPLDVTTLYWGVVSACSETVLFKMLALTPEVALLEDEETLHFSLAYNPLISFIQKLVVLGLMVDANVIHRALVGNRDFPGVEDFNLVIPSDEVILFLLKAFCCENVKELYSIFDQATYYGHSQDVILAIVGKITEMESSSKSSEESADAIEGVVGCTIL